MLVEWTKHLPSEDEKQDFRRKVQGSKIVLDRLVALLEEYEQTLDRVETNIENYSTPSWDYRQAHKNGNREMIYRIKKLVNLDQQRGIEINDRPSHDSRRGIP